MRRLFSLMVLVLFALPLACSADAPVGNFGSTCVAGNSGGAWAGCSVLAPIEHYVKVHVYVGTTAAAGQGYDPGPAVDQAVMWEMQYAHGSACAQDPTCNGDSPNTSTGVPHSVLYGSFPWDQCGNSLENAWITWAFSQGDETVFTHTVSSAYSSANRFSRSYNGVCTVAGGTSGGTYTFFPNPANSSSNAEWKSVFFSSGNSYINGRTYVWTMADNYTPYGIWFSNDCSCNVADSGINTVQSGRASLATMSNAFAPYQLVTNSLGTGGGNFPNNNVSPPSANVGVLNYAVDTADFCNNLTGGNVRSMVTEKPWTSNSTITLNPYDITVLVNTATQIWGNPKCSGVDVEQLNFTSDPSNNTDNINLRMMNKAMEMIMEPPLFGCHQSDPQIVEWQYTTTPNSATQAAVYPENNFCAGNPVQPGVAWIWSGNGDGNGCGAGDIGGMASFVKSCGSGVDSKGFNSGVLVREFNNCYIYGVSVGPCAAIVNNTTSSQVVPSGTTWLSKGTAFYTHILMISGSGPQTFVDDNVANGTICPSINGCGGSIGLATWAGSGSTLPAQSTSYSSQFAIVVYQ